MKEIGDYITGYVGGIPVVVVRNQNGDLEGLINVCRHRRHEVMKDCGNAKILQCRYHAWTYDLSGQLKAAPRSDQAIYGVPTRPRASANLALSGAISSAAGSAGSLGLTNLFFMDQQIQLHKMRKKGLLPEQLLAERLHALDDLDDMLKSPNKSAR